MTRARSRAAKVYEQMDPSETDDFGYRVRKHKNSQYLQKKGQYEALQQFATN